MPKTIGDSAPPMFPAMFIIPDTVPEFLLPTSIGTAQEPRRLSTGPISVDGGAGLRLRQANRPSTFAPLGVTIMGDTPPRDPNDDEDDDDAAEGEDEEDDDEPAVIREPDE
jgi:hypothetical protein